MRSLLLLLAFVVAFRCARPPESTATVQREVSPNDVASRPSDGTMTPVSNPIDVLIARLSTSHGLWTNGMFPPIDSPSGAATETVLRGLFDRISFRNGKVKSFAIVEERDVTIAPDTTPYRAARINSDQGNMIVLLRYESYGWWTRAFDE